MFVPQVFVGMFTGNEELVNYANWAIRIYMAVIFSIGFQMCCQQSFMALGQAKVSLLLACLRKIILLIPLIFILPMFMENKVFAVFIAEPISDMIAAIITTTVFLLQFEKILNKNRI
jgi:Na+-driven multidrug efflux pump